MNRCELSSSVLLSSRDFSSQPEMEARVVGDYVVGPERIGTGSFAVVWKGRHLHEGNEVAVKEIDKTKLSTKVKESLMKEITILRQVSHPNIVKLHHALQTDDKLYLMLEYCTGGDLAAYLHRHGRVSETVARHFMRQLASGLLVLRENNLIHRDLKPQNLLLCTRDETPVLKIGDFGFARYLMPHGLADTLCGSPLYMAPEIIQNRKYDAKADLWSVGAILFQLVTSRPPFEGNTQFQLFQNILTSDELQFPQGVAAYLNPDCIDLCRRLLRRNPVERLAFEDFFNHSFLAMPRCIGSALEFSPTSSNENIKVPCGKSSDLANSENTKKSDTKELFSRTGDSNVSDSFRFINDNANENFSSSVGGPSKSENSKCLEDGVRNQDLLRKTAPKIDDSVESIARGYVLVHAHSASMETLALSLEASSGESSPAKFLSYTQKKSDVPTTLILMQGGESATGSACCVKSIRSQMSSASTGSGTSASKHVTGSASANPSIRLKVLYQYLHTLSELAQEKLNAKPHLGSLSVELVALAVWKETFWLCNSWIPYPTGGDTLNSFFFTQ